MDPSPLVRTRIGDRRATLHRTGPLTPYLAQLLADDLRRRGGGVRLEVTVAADADAAEVAAVRGRLAPLLRKGSRVVCRRRRGGRIELSLVAGEAAGA